MAPIACARSSAGSGHGCGCIDIRVPILQVQTGQTITPILPEPSHQPNHIETSQITNSPAESVLGPKPRRRPGPQALDTSERDAVLQVINQAGYGEMSIGQIWIRELDETGPGAHTRFHRDGAGHGRGSKPVST
jgi:hypothetical protein